MFRKLLYNLALFACVAGVAMSQEVTLPHTVLQLPAEVQQDLIYGASKPQYHWDADGYFPYPDNHIICDAIQIESNRELAFNYYPHGGYMVLAHVDLVGDSTPEQVYMVFEPNPRKGDTMRKAYLYSRDGRFYYAMRPECIYSKKVGKISRGWYKEMALWPQWELREDSADYVQWRWSKSRDCIRFNSHRYLFTANGTLETDWDSHSYEINLSDAPDFIKKGMPKPWGYVENASKVTFYITSVYELIMTEKAEWMKWESDLTEGLRHWNETREEVMKSSRGTTAQQAYEKLQSIIKQKPQRSAYPLFDDNE